MSTAIEQFPNIIAEREKFLLGYVNSYDEVTPRSVGISDENAPREVLSVEIDDPYVSVRSAAERAEVKFYEQQADAYARERRLNGHWERTPGTAYYDVNGNEQQKKGWGDPEAREMFFGALNNPAINIWRDLIPSAKALKYLSEPTETESITSADGLQTAEIDEDARKWLSLCTDAIGIRSRATVMSEAVKDFIETRGENTTDRLRWMSVACGTALPTIKAAVSAGASPEVILVDLDSEAMQETNKLANELGFNGDIRQCRLNIFNPKDMKKLGEKLENEGGLPELIDLMGIFEYTGEHTRVDPVEFLRTNYDLLRPGGRLIFGQMRSDRPVSDFTMGVVSWPYIEMRTPDEFMQVIKEAGISQSETRLFLPSDGVYTVGVIDKPILRPVNS